MSWQKIKIITTAANAEYLSELLTAAGAIAVSFEDAGDQPIFEPLQEIFWEKTCVCGLFDATINPQEIWKLLQQQANNELISSFHSEILPDKNWIKETQSNFSALKFGKKLWVVPSWEKTTAPSNSVIVLLDPGVAFGTGTHETTRLCLEWLEANVKPHDRVIDYGCGSGILGIAALKLGAEEVWAVDYDSQALAATATNAQRNQMSVKRLITATPEQSPPWQADILIANILAQPLIELATKFANLIKPKGKIVLSGILREQVEYLIASYNPWFEMLAPAFKNDWARLEGIRKN